MSKEKVYEARKTRPNLDTLFKTYIVKNERVFVDLRTREAG